MNIIDPLRLKDSVFMKNPKPFRLDAVDKVTGRAKYSADYYFPKMQYAKVLWPSVSSGIVKKISIAAAQEIDGVTLIITRSNISGPNISGIFQFFDRPILIGEGEIIKCNSDPLAIVVAISEDIADHALSLINVEINPIDHADSLYDALANNDKPVFEKTIEKGNINKGFDEADVVVRQNYFCPLGEHAYIEPEAGVVYKSEQGVINIIVGSQDLTQNQRMICKSLELPFNMVHIHSPFVGGAFGGKHAMSVQVYLALIGILVDFPVKMTWTREESLAHSCKKQGHIISATLGIKKNGKITAFKAELVGPCGPYHGNTQDNCSGVLAGMIGPYNQPNIHIHGRMFDVLLPELGAFRGVGAPDGTFVIETIIELAANKIHMSGLEIRKKNWFRNNEDIKTLFPGATARNGSERWCMNEVVELALSKAGSLPKPSAPNRFVGRGFANASCAYMNGNTPFHKGSTAQIDMFLDGTIVVKTGFAELGEGITGIITHFASVGLGISEDRISVNLGDTHLTTKSGALGFSQATVNLGNAILDAATKLKNHIEFLAKRCIGAPNKEIEFRNSNFYYKHTNDLACEWQTFSDYCFHHVEPLSATGRFVGDLADEYQYSITPVACIADVEVDPETGNFKILQIIQSHDVGKVIQPESARGQMVGATVMQIGITMFENFMMDNGEILTPSFSEYLIPTTLDIPIINEVHFFEGNLGINCPEGAKGLGEHGMYTVGAAIANAIFNATGIMVTKIPLSPETFLEASGKIPSVENRCYDYL